MLKPNHFYGFTQSTRHRLDRIGSSSSQGPYHSIFALYIRRKASRSMMNDFPYNWVPTPAHLHPFEPMMEETFALRALRMSNRTASPCVRLNDAKGCQLSTHRKVFVPLPTPYLIQDCIRDLSFMIFRIDQESFGGHFIAQKRCSLMIYVFPTNPQSIRFLGNGPNVFDHSSFVPSCKLPF